jgi:tetratricopeptide (TPR) repeat protein
VRKAFEWLLAHDREQALALVAQLGTRLNFWELGGFFQEGRRWLQRALDESQGVVSLQRAHALLAAAELSSAIPDLNYGLQCARQAQQLFQDLGDQQREIDARLKYCGLADLADQETNLKGEIEEALHMAERIAYTAGIAKAKCVLGSFALYTGDPEAAIQYLLPSVALWRKAESPFELARVLNNFGAACAEIGEHGAARQAYEESRHLYQSLGYRRGVALAIHNLGETALKLGEHARARELLCESLRMRYELSLPRGYAYSFEQLAHVNEREEHFEQAVQLWAAAETLRVRIGAPPEQIEQKDAAAALARLRARLGEVGFELEWAKGVHLTTEQAITLALS